MEFQDYYKTLGVERKGERCGDQERVPQARPQIPSRRQSQQQGSRGQIQADKRGLPGHQRRREAQEIRRARRRLGAWRVAGRDDAPLRAAAIGGRRRRWRGIRRGLRSAAATSAISSRNSSAAARAARADAAAAARHADFRISISAPSRRARPIFARKLELHCSMRSKAPSGGSIWSPRTNAPPAAAAG